MKPVIAFLFICSFFAASKIKAQSGFDTSVTITDITDTIRPLSVFAGTRVMVVILPVTQTADDSAYVIKLDSICDMYAGRLKVLGVLSYEDGYSDSAGATIKSWYAAIKSSNLIITTGIYTHKSSTGQHDFFGWLTHADQNVHFDDEVSGVGEKFFIDERGALFSVYGPEVGLSTRLVQLNLQ